MGVTRQPKTEAAESKFPATIVVVDDEEDIADLMGHLLAREGYRVVCATSGADALRYLEGASVDLVLSDYAMPGMDGAELLRNLCGKPDTANVPVVLVSAFPEEAVRRNCASMRAFLRKPFRASELLDTVREILG